MDPIINHSLQFFLAPQDRLKTSCQSYTTQKEWRFPQKFQIIRNQKLWRARELAKRWTRPKLPGVFRSSSRPLIAHRCIQATQEMICIRRLRSLPLLSRPENWSKMVSSSQNHSLNQNLRARVGLGQREWSRGSRVSLLRVVTKIL